MAAERLFTFTRLPPTRWRSARTTNAIERLHEEFKRRIKTQTVLPSADTAAMLFWALLGRMRAVPARCVPCCMTSGIKNHLDGVVRGSEEETLTIADTSA